MTTFFTADTHFMHANIIKYCNRPFHGTDEMDEVLIRKWNERVGYNDQVYHLGDFGMRNSAKLSDILCRLNGKKFLIRGNHDAPMEHPDCVGYWAWIKDVFMLKIQDKAAPEGVRHIWLSHYAHMVWPAQHYGAWHLFAHSHGHCDAPFLKSFDVGVDVWDFRPVSYEEIIHVMKGKRESQ